jgi:hypothetical protein
MVLEANPQYRLGGLLTQVFLGYQNGSKSRAARCQLQLSLLVMAWEVFGTMG